MSDRVGVRRVLCSTVVHRKYMAYWTDGFPIAYLIQRGGYYVSISLPDSSLSPDCRDCPVEKHFVTPLDPLDILDLPNFEKILKITI